MVDGEYIQQHLQKAVSIKFSHLKLKDDVDFCSLAFNYNTEHEALLAWDYVMYRIINEEVFITLRINEDNKLEILLDLRNIGIKIATVHDNFNQFDLSFVIEHIGLVYEDTVFHISCNYYDKVSGNHIPLYLGLAETGKAIISKVVIHRLDSDGHSLIPPPELPSLF